jgi:protein phosphatase
MSIGLDVAARSDTGLVRENNEDAAYAGPHLVALADGMGGPAAGELASQFVVDALATLDENECETDLAVALTEAMHRGNEAIAGYVEAHPDLAGMGCTLTALLCVGNRLGVLNVGDSRAYLMREGEFTQITRDDSVVQHLIEEGTLSLNSARSHPQRSVILKALTGVPVEPTITIREVRIGDRYLLCSDGLSDPTSFETIAVTLAEGTPDETADRLVELALRSGGPDNITLVVADVVDTAESAGPSMCVGAASHESTPEHSPDTSAGRAAALTRRH